MNYDHRFEALHLELPPAPEPRGVYTPVVQVGNLLYLSGHLPVNGDGSLIKGKLGQELDEEVGKQAALQVGLTLLATLKKYLGTLNRVTRVVKVVGMVNAVPEFEKHPYVINGCSELLATVFGSEIGIGARSAIGVGSLPENVPVEIEAIIQISAE